MSNYRNHFFFKIEMKFLTVYIEVISCMHYSCVVGHSDSRWPAKCAVKML